MATVALRASTRKLRDLLPQPPPVRPIEYDTWLVAYVSALAAAGILLATLTVRGVSNPATVAVGAFVAFVAAYCSVRLTDRVDSVWSAAVFIHLALTFTFGPLGAAAASVPQAVATGLRMRFGWFRGVFNLSAYFLCDMCAWLAFSELMRRWPGLAGGAAAATIAGAVQCVVNHALLAGVIKLASPGRGAKLWSVFTRSIASSILYSVGYGWAAFGAVLLHRVAGTIGFTTTLLPVILLQGFLVLLARRIRAQELEREAHTREREALLQQAIDASDLERKRIASDLHDGVVQTLAGLALSLAARGSGPTQDPQLLEAAGTLRSSVTDLRTLMIEIAPPDLGSSGVDAALRKLLEPLPAKGIAVELEADAATHIPPDKTSLVFRVAQEAIRNVVNHSHATKVTTTLRVADGTLTLQVADNGRGFSADDRSRRREEGHVGLHLLNNAVEASSGSLSLQSEPGHGTSLMLTLPC